MYWRNKELFGKGKKEKDVILRIFLHLFLNFSIKVGLML